MTEVFENDAKPPPKIHRNVLKELLYLCTTKVPFKHINGKIYIQIDGVTMGSPLGPTFANYYMADLKNKVLNEKKPPIYARYVDDIFIVSKIDDLINLKEEMENNSKLKFTYEEPVNGTLPFLDILVTKQDYNIKTTVYKKKTDVGKCLNYKSECTERYKEAVMKAYINRTIQVCSSWELADEEIERITQILVNNNYPQHLIEKEIKASLDSYSKKEQRKKEKVNLYYQNQMNDGYKMDEKVLKTIIRNNVKSTDSEKKVNLIIYYKNLKTINLIMQNNSNPEKRNIDKTRIIYEYKCPNEDCYLLKENKNNSYIGYTTCKLTRRIAYHLQNGAIKEHEQTCYETKMTRIKLVENCKIVKQINDIRRLQNMEAIMINKLKPELNKQDTGITRILQLWA